MERSLAYLMVVILLIAIGIALSFYGAQLSTQNLEIIEEEIERGSSLEINAELDPLINNEGVFVVQKFGDAGDLSVTVFDPSGIEIISQKRTEENLEEQFEIYEKGTYRLLIENIGNSNSRVAGVIGHMPDNLTISIGITGFYLLIIGLIGTVGVGIYVMKNRKKKKIN